MHFLSKTCVFIIESEVKQVQYDFYESQDEDPSEETGIICVHDLLYNRLGFTQLAEAMMGFINVCCLDLPGHGNSHCVDNYNIDVLLESCISVLNSCNFKRCIWIGHGLGGMLGIKLASMKNSPIIGLILDEVKYRCSYTNMQNPLLKINGNTYFSLEALANNMVQHLIYQTSLQDRMRFVIRNFELYNSEFKPSYDFKLLNLEGEVDIYDNWKQVNCPILMITPPSKSGDLITQNMVTKDCVLIKSRERNNIVPYNKYEQELIGSWIKKIISSRSAQDHFAIGSG